MSRTTIQLLTGSIIMYSWDISGFPTDTRALCDGNNATPDLRWQFIRGWSDATGQEYSGSPARRDDLQTEAIQSHQHHITRDLLGSEGTGVQFAANQGISDFTGATTDNTWWPETRPKNYAIAFIMKR